MTEQTKEATAFRVMHVGCPHCGAFRSHPPLDAPFECWSCDKMFIARHPDGIVIERDPITGNPVGTDTVTKP